MSTIQTISSHSETQFDLFVLELWISGKIPHAILEQYTDIVVH